MDEDNRDPIVRKLRKRSAALEAERQPWMKDWRILAEHFLPHRMFSLSEGDKANDPRTGGLNNKLYDSLSIRAMRVLAAGMQGGMTSPARPWLRLTLEGIDVSEDMLKIARQNATQDNLSGRIDFRQASGAGLPFADGYFALVTSNASLHLWTDPLQVLQEIARVTSPGGYCLIWDNLRLTMLNPLLSLLGRVMGMNVTQRRLWMQAIQSSYTIGEVKAIIRESALKDARVRINPGFFELSITWNKCLKEIPTREATF